MYPHGPFADPWLDSGASGIVLPFIRAYSLTGNTRYKELAEITLHQHQKHLVTPYLSVLSGAAGIGEIYLEAWNAFGSDEWRDRAGWIAQLILHTCQPAPGSGVCWVTDNSTIPTADLLTGTTGLLLYLMRWLEPEKLPFQIFG